MRFAILIGINDYSAHTPLSYCVKDAENLNTAFVDFCNVPESNVYIITSSATRPQSSPWRTLCEIILKIQEVFIPREDDIFFYFSGHGVPGEQTTVVFKDESKTITEIISELDKLAPKTKILIFDSCYSGSGYIEADRSAQFFSYSSKLTSGYYILTACTNEQKAKESSLLQNGKFTRFLINTLADKQNYKNDYLDVNTLFGLVDVFFKSNTEYSQNPFVQIKSIGSYPIANSFDEAKCYVRFDIDNPTEYDWNRVAVALDFYLCTKESVKGEFLKLIREHCDNTLSSMKGNASIQRIEISKNKVSLTDDGVFFDLFEPYDNVVPGGGIKTANDFAADFSSIYLYEKVKKDGFNSYVYSFKSVHVDGMCSINVDFSKVYTLRFENIIIPEECDTFSVRFYKYALLNSHIHSYITKFKKVAASSGKSIFLEFHECEIRLIAEVEEAIHRYDAMNFLKVRTFSD